MTLHFGGAVTAERNLQLCRQFKNIVEQGRVKINFYLSQVDIIKYLN